MTRAFFNLPDIWLALSYHPLFFIVPFVPLLPIFSEKNRNIIATILIILFLGTWLARMLLLFPHTEPMTINQSSLMQFLLGRFR